MTIKDIAKELGLSVATVSRVLNKHKNVSFETRKKVQDLMDETMYTPNAIARNLSNQNNKTIAVLVPNISNPFFADLINIICKYFYKVGYGITLYNTSEDLCIEEASIKKILEQRVSGVVAILMKSKYVKNPLDTLERFHIPCVLLDRELEDSDMPGVFIDNIKGAYDITKKLITEGHKDIAIITGDLNLKTAKDRLKGYEKAHREIGLDINSKNIYIGDFTLDSGYNAACKILETNSTAIFACNNVMLVGVLKLLTEKNKHLRLACFESLDILNILNYNVLSCNIPLEEMGKEVFEILKNKTKDRIYIEPVMRG
ncbi:LacI family DNA-binding transcriptional regulator [Cetobacterium sp. 2A]|uniref:LacI family DNA-binding transcriptional regulator n=1 Tax=Cetobacterium sp. 2A TaxID=2754723 RepID=UPI00163C53DA|nr:LacI family DNA-binding transcriptional regulator [Cetobacterium sp. 2A]MBC2856898.1 LacI family DNA-binding transcriptional regulator [Cetobacterium sp. 2A]